MRVVIDTNVLVSGFTSSRGAPAQLLLLWLADAFTLVLSEYILTEVSRTFNEPYFQERMSSEERRDNLGLLRRFAEFVLLTDPIEGIAPDPNDDPILTTVISGDADYLITGDRALRSLQSYRAIPILSPREFLNILEMD